MSGITVGFNQILITITEGEVATVCAEIIEGRIGRSVVVSLDAPPRGGTAVCKCIVSYITYCLPGMHFKAQVDTVYQRVVGLSM